MAEDLYKKLEEQRLFGEELQRNFNELKQKVDKLEKPIEEADQFKDVDHDAIRIIDVLHAGLPVLTSAPTYTGFEGEMVWVLTGGKLLKYGYTGGTWYKIGDLIDDTTPQLGGDLDMNEHNIIFDAIPSTDDTGIGIIIDDISAGESIAFYDLVYIKSDGEWWRVNAEAIATCQGLIGIALESKTDGQACKVLIHGFVRNDDWNWTVGSPIYAVSGTAGELTQAPETTTDDVIKIVGVATHVDRMYFNPEMTTVVHA